MSQRIRRGLAVWLTASRSPVFVLDERRMVLVFNRGCEELTGRSAADVIGKICQFQHDPDPARVTSITGALCPAEALSADKPHRKQALFLLPDGQGLEREIHFFPLLPEAGTSGQHWLGIITALEAAPPPVSPPALNASRHTADLFRKYRADRIVAITPAMQRVVAQLELARQQPVTVHLVGEAGTGREHVARLIHYGSPLSDRRFVPLRCQTATHFELQRTISRLGEDSARQEVGTVYLERIDALPGDLLPLVEEQLARFPGRWISSSPAGLEGLSEEQFPPELLAKLTSLTIALPPLRLRAADLPVLAQQLLEEANLGRSLQHTEFSAAVLRLFAQHAWPGNVEELARIISQACERAASPIVDLADLPYDFIASLESRSIRPPAPIRSLDEELLQFERNRILETLQAARGNKTLAAERLGIPRPRLYRRLEQLGLLNEADTEAPESESR